LDTGRGRTSRRGRAIPSRDGQARDLRILNSIAVALNSSPNVEQALARTLGLVADLLDVETGWVWMLEPDSGQFYSAATLNLPPYLQDPVRMTGHHCWCIGSFLEGELTPKNVDVMECSRLRPAVRANADELTRGLRSHASIPLYSRGKPLGIMNLTKPSWRKLTPRELRLLTTIAYQVGIAVERARLAEDSTRLARTEERARIAREIHDTLAQSLTGIGLDLEGALRHLDGDPARARERLERALGTTRASLEDARRSVLDLRASPLEGKPLVEALGALGRALTSDTGVPVRVRADPDVALSPRAEAELFRIAQEAMTNVRKHARASRVDLELRRTGHDVRLSVRDDGLGFDPRAASTVDGHGLLGMRERARLLGGRLRVRSRSGRGATIAATVPPAPPGLPGPPGPPGEDALSDKGAPT
jgi:two-component system, NarL family, sensor kinase